jgi:hypothetical protein
MITKPGNPRILHITTPNNHVLTLSTIPNVNSSTDKSCIYRLSSNCIGVLNEKELKDFDNAFPLMQIVWCQYSQIYGHHASIIGFWCIANQTFWTNSNTISDLCSHDNCRGCSEQIYFVATMFHSNLLHYVLQYDRECENAKALQLISQTCARMGGMAELLEFVESAVKIVKEDYKKDK